MTNRPVKYIAWLDHDSVAVGCQTEQEAIDKAMAVYNSDDYQAWLPKRPVVLRVTFGSNQRLVSQQELNKAI